MLALKGCDRRIRPPAKTIRPRKPRTRRYAGGGKSLEQLDRRQPLLTRQFDNTLARLQQDCRRRSGQNYGASDSVDFLPIQDSRRQLRLPKPQPSHPSRDSWIGVWTFPMLPAMC